MPDARLFSRRLSSPCLNTPTLARVHRHAPPQLFKGDLHYRCALPGFVETPGHASLRNAIHPSLGQVSDAPPSPDQTIYDTGAFCSATAVAGSDDAGQCAAGSGTQCAYFDEDPGNGLTSFDSVGLTFVVLMQAITFDDWATPMYALMSHDPELTYLVVSYFLAIVVLGGFFVVNLFLAVIFEEFLEEKEIDAASRDVTGEGAGTYAVAPASANATKGGAHAKGQAADKPKADEQMARAKAREAAGASRSSAATPLLRPSLERSDSSAAGNGFDGRGGSPSSPFVGGPSLMIAAFDDSAAAEALLAARASQWQHGESGSGDWSLRSIATSSALNNGATALVVLNLVLMAMPYEGMSETFAARLEATTFGITLAFIGEMGLKIVGLGWGGYWADRWNVLDGTIVSLSIGELLITDILSFLENGSVPNLSFLRILRMLRVMRMLRLMKSWKGLYRILSTFLRALMQISNLFVLMFLIMWIFALIGMQSFGGQYSEANGFSQVPCLGGVVCPDPGLEERPHYHFDYFGPAMNTVFILMSGEWIDALDPAAATTGKSAVFYFLAVVLIGRYLIFNLFIGILLGAFGEDDESSAGGAAAGGADRDGVSTGVDGTAAPGAADASAGTLARNTFREGEGSRAGSPSHGRAGGVASWPSDYALCLFPPQHPLRRACKLLVSLEAFDRFVMLMIIASCVCLALDSPRLDPASELAETLRSLDVLWTVLFTSEMLLKIVAYGFACSEEAYLTSAWNQLDATIVCASLTVLLAEHSPSLMGDDAKQHLRSVRMLRVLRPLRLVSRNAGMKLIVTSLLKAMPMVLDSAAVVLALMGVFAILGMQLFMGRLASCTDPTILTRAECTAAGMRAVFSVPGRSLKGGGGGGEAVERSIRWINPSFGSFDSFGAAMKLLTIMMTGDEWESPMFAMQAAVSRGVAPERDDYDAAGAIFSIAWMFIGSFFALNLFVGVICDSFTHIKNENDGKSATMTAEQQQWVNTMNAIVRSAPDKGVRPPNGIVRALLFQLVTSSLFDGFITMVIILNIGVMSCDYWGIEHDVENHNLYRNSLRGESDLARASLVRCCLRRRAHATRKSKRAISDRHSHA